MVSSMKRKRPVLYELVRKAPRDGGNRPRSSIPPVAAPVPPPPPSPAPAPAPRAPYVPPTSNRNVADTDPPPRPASVRPGLSPAVAAGGSGGRPLYVPSRDGAAVVEKLLAALRKWGQSIQSAPPWATVLGLVATIAFFVFICFRIYGAFVVKDVPQTQTESTSPPAVVTPPPRPDASSTSRREVPSIGGGSRVATPGRGNDAAPESKPEPKPDTIKPAPKDETAAPPAPPDAALPAISGQFEKGTYYIHVQHFGKGKRDEAIAAHQFLRSEGIACSLIDTKADLAILLDEPFQLGLKDAKQRGVEQKRVDEAKKRIRDLGKKYVKNAGGKYSFRDCVEKAY